MTEEIFKPIPNYEGLYEVSNLGNIRSYNKAKANKNNMPYIMRQCSDSQDYKLIRLTSNKISKNFRTHVLVAMAFLNHVPCGHRVVVDHINGNRYDNRLENLQLISHRDNVYKIQGKGLSKYKGVSFDKSRQKWISYIRINYKLMRLGYFKTEYEAHIAYQNALQKHLNNEQPIQSSTKATENIC